MYTIYIYMYTYTRMGHFPFLHKPRGFINDVDMQNLGKRLYLMWNKKVKGLLKKT